MTEESVYELKCPYCGNIDKILDIYSTLERSISTCSKCKEVYVYEIEKRIVIKIGKIEWDEQ